MEGTDNSELINTLKTADKQIVGLTSRTTEKLNHENPVKKITVEDLQSEIITPKSGETLIMLMRNGKDKENRKLPTNSPDFGSLDPGENEKIQSETTTNFDKIFQSLSEEEKKTVDILIVAGNTELLMPDKRASKHKRAVETGDQMILGIQESMKKNNISEKQLLNLSATEDGGPVQVSVLKDLKLIEDSPEYTQFLIDKYGDGLDFWNAYEDDRHRDIRLQMQAEGPSEIANRIHSFMSIINIASTEYHKTHPGRRLIVGMIGHYDCISPYLKEHVVGMPTDAYLPIDYRAGIAIKVGVNGVASTNIQGQTYNLV